MRIYASMFSGDTKLRTFELDIRRFRVIKKQGVCLKQFGLCRLDEKAGLDIWVGFENIIEFNNILLIISKASLKS